MKVINTKLEDVYIIEPLVHSDSRGWFFEAWSNRDLLKNQLNFSFVQENHSFSLEKGTLRGLHFQANPKAQSKLVRCTAGSIMDVVVDIRKDSPTYQQWIKIELSSNNFKQLLIPKGCAHGFLTLKNNTEVQYITDEYYYPEYDAGFAWDDKDVGITWGVSSPILSEKDKKAPALINSKANFEYNNRE